ncbi:hypothetical protein LT493_20695 [Streptomyces tricolor]|nr:hypothetical protein [Streptomyces tricolor]
MGCVVAVGFAAGSSQTLLMTALQPRSPAHVLGRVASLRLFVAWGPRRADAGRRVVPC